MKTKNNGFFLPNFKTLNAIDTTHYRITRPTNSLPCPAVGCFLSIDASKDITRPQPLSGQRHLHHKISVRLGVSKYEDKKTPSSVPRCSESRHSVVYFNPCNTSCSLLRHVYKNILQNIPITPYQGRK